MFGLGGNFIVYLNMTVAMYCTDFATDIKLIPLLYNEMLSYDNFTT